MSKASLTPEFVTAPADDSRKPATIQKVVGVDCYLAQFNDGKGESNVQIIFKVPGSEVVFLLKDTISGTRIVSNATPWFQKQFNEIISTKKDLTSIASGSSDEDGVGTI